MQTFIIHVPFEQHDAFEVEANSVEAAVEIARNADRYSDSEAAVIIYLPTKS